MFNVRPDAGIPGFRFRPPEDIPGFCIDGDGGIGRTLPGDGVATLDADLSGGIGTPTLVPGPGGDGGGRGTDKCLLMPGFEQFGMCLYRCPDGTVRRLDRGPLGCQLFIFRGGGLGV